MDLPNPSKMPSIYVLLRLVKTASEDMTIGEIRSQCFEKVQNGRSRQIERSMPPGVKPGAISRRVLSEKQHESDPYVITPHLMNYVLPVLSTNNINRDAYGSNLSFQDNFTDFESKFQLSIKAPLNSEDIFFPGDSLYFAFTLEAWWQIYSDNISKPFRETNYRPEFFYIAPLNWHPLGGNTGFMVGVEHQSNGRSQLLSRSWNRAYASLLFEKDNLAISLKPWWRLPEEDKTSPLDPEGDDNPDILDYMGHFELTIAHTWDDYEVSLMSRRNFEYGRGALELGFTFPLWGKLRGYALIFDGYGESLIDYNHRQTRFGLGIALNDIL